MTSRANSSFSAHGSLLVERKAPNIIILESPYAGDIARHQTYWRAAMRDSLGRGEIPFSSHFVYTQVLRDDDKEQRKQGIACGYAFWPFAKAVVFYTDLGVSTGMEAARKRADLLGMATEFRQIGV